MNAPKNQLGAQPSKNDFRFSHSGLAQGFFIVSAENHAGSPRNSLDMGKEMSSVRNQLSKGGVF
jgi:hypothetical protein